MAFKLFKKKEKKKEEQLVLKEFNTNEFSLTETKQKPSDKNHITIFGFKIDEADVLAGLLTSDKKVLVIGDTPYLDQGEKIVRKYGSQSVFKMEIESRVNNSIDLFNPDIIFISCSYDNAPSFFRNVLYHSSSYADIVFPASKAGWFSIDRFTLGKPILYISSPAAGSNRLSGQLHYLMQKLGKKYSFFGPSVRNSEFNNDDSTLKVITSEQIDDLLYERMRYVEFFEILEFHKWTTLGKVLNSKDYEIILLTRDPRDVINTVFWFFQMMHRKITDHLLNHCEPDPQKFLKQLVYGGYTYSDTTNTLGGAYLTWEWPSLDEMLDILLSAKKASNVHTISFEDLHKNNTIAMHNLLKSLKLVPNPLFEFTQADWDHAKLISSFKFQSNGTLARGSNNTYKKSQINIHSCRKGIVGDWKNLFGPDITKNIKSKYLDKFTELGYQF